MTGSAIVARKYHQRVTHYLTKSVSYSDTGIASGNVVKFNHALPANAFVTQATVKIKTVFNAATTNVLTVGTNSSTTNNIVAAGDVDETAAAVTQVKGVGVIDTSAPLDVYVKYTQTGTAATTGAADIVIEYVIMEPNN